MTYWKLNNIPVKATDKQLRLPQAINHSWFFFQLWNLFCFLVLFSVQSAAWFYFINAPSHTMSRNSYRTLMSMATDLLGGLCYTTYGLVIANCYSKACVCKITHNTNNQALQVLWHPQVSCCQYDQMMLNVLLLHGAMHPQNPLNLCTTFMLCLPTSCLELQHWSALLYAMHLTKFWYQHIFYSEVQAGNNKFEWVVSTNIITHITDNETMLLSAKRWKAPKVKKKMCSRRGLNPGWWIISSLRNLVWQVCNSTFHWVIKITKSCCLEYSSYKSHCGMARYHQVLIW